MGQLPRRGRCLVRLPRGAHTTDDIASKLLTSAFIPDRHSMGAAEKGQEPLSPGEDAIHLPAPR